jgi:hypothetical protein
MLEYLQELRDGRAPLDPLRSSLKDLKTKLAVEFGGDAENIGFDHPEMLRTLLDQVEQVLVNRLG